MRRAIHLPGAVPLRRKRRSVIPTARPLRSAFRRVIDAIEPHGHTAVNVTVLLAGAFVVCLLVAERFAT